MTTTDHTPDTEPTDYTPGAYPDWVPTYPAGRTFALFAWPPVSSAPRSMCIVTAFILQEGDEENIPRAVALDMYSGANGGGVAIGHHEPTEGEATREGAIADWDAENVVNGVRYAPRMVLLGDAPYASGTVTEPVLDDEDGSVLWDEDEGTEWELWAIPPECVVI